MIKIQFSSESISKLRELSLNHPHERVRLKALALLMKSQEIPHHQIAVTLGICGNTLCGYLRAYQDDDLSVLTKNNYRGSTSSLAKFEDVIREYIKNQEAQDKHIDQLNLWK